MAWACISTLFVIRLCRAHRQLCRILAKAVPVEPSIQAFCDRLAAKLQVTPPRVVCSPFFSSPLLAGVLHPVVHLSSDAKDDFGSAQTDGLRDILVHELAHLKRHDVLLRMISQFVLAVFFFQPLLWRLSKWLESNAIATVCLLLTPAGGQSPRRSVSESLQPKTSKSCIRASSVSLAV
jgi:beta-lactamase regulating signal transducer with metallopeptidase domain